MNPNLATIKLSVEHNTLRLVKNIDATTMAIGAIQVVFDFPEQSEWQNLQKTAVFVRGTDNRAQILDSNNSCLVPWETLNVSDTHGDIIYDVGVFGTANGIRIPTNKVRLKIKEGCYVQGQAPATPTPDVYSQITTMIQNLNDYNETEIKAFVAEYLTDNDYATETYVDTHANNTVKHVTQADKDRWNSNSSPITSVNGKTGAVILNKADIGLTKVSDLTNDSGYLTSHQDISGKVDKEIGKGLSTNDLTNALKSNYDSAYTHSTSAHAPSDAEANVQSDWNQTNTSADDYIKNKPTIPSAYILPTASANTLGGIKVGNGLSIDVNGVLSAGTIIDADNYYTSTTVEGALQEIGATLAGINTLLGTGVIS